MEAGRSIRTAQGTRTAAEGRPPVRGPFVLVSTGPDVIDAEPGGCPPCGLVCDHTDWFLVTDHDSASGTPPGSTVPSRPVKKKEN